MPITPKALRRRNHRRVWLALGFIFLIFREFQRWREREQYVDEGDWRMPQDASTTTEGSWTKGESMTDVLSGIRNRPQFNLSNPVVHQYAELLEGMMSVFSRIDGVKEGMGSTGMVNQKMLRLMGLKPQFMSCAGHIRIVDGKVYFRYGGFIMTWYRLRRFNQSIKMIQDAINWYGLKDLRIEFFFNTCDMPMSFDNILSTSHRAGYCVLSTQSAVGTTDIIVPDPLDLAPDYMPNTAHQAAWEEKEDRAIFRGASTNYDLREFTWRASPRVRLHRMSDLHSDVMDAKIMRWSHINDYDMNLIEEDELYLGKRIDHKQKNKFKYEIAVDGGVGTCRTCGLLASNMLMIRQASGFSQFFEPLLKPGEHYLTTEHHFQDLPEVIEWARENDDLVENMVENANKVARWACTWEGRTLYWAIALAKYATNVMDKSVVVEKPKELCGGKPQKSVLEVYQGYGGGGAPKCGAANEKERQPNCVHWCTFNLNKEENWQWLSSDVFENLERLGPHQD